MLKTIIKTSMVALLASALLILGAAGTANANTVTFNFSSVSYSASATNSSNAADAAIQTYMDAALAAAGCPTCTVTVYGGVADRTWDGDGHVVGPSGHAVTLATYGGNANAISNSATPTGTLGVNALSSGTTGTFLADTNDQGTQVGVGAQNEIYLKFNFPVTGTVSFDYEIFPCATGGCTSPPGLTFEAGNNSNGTDTSIANFSGLTPSASAVDGSSVQSDVSSNESSSQLIGYYSTSLGSSATELDFLDWPATIGIDNLTINVPTTTPEPGSLLLLASGLAGLAFLARRKAQVTI